MPLRALTRAGAPSAAQILVVIYPGILITILAFAVYWMEPEAQPVESPLLPCG